MQSELGLYGLRETPLTWAPLILVGLNGIRASGATLGPKVRLITIRDGYGGLA